MSTQTRTPSRLLPAVVLALFGTLPAAALAAPPAAGPSAPLRGTEYVDPPAAQESRDARRHDDDDDHRGYERGRDGRDGKMRGAFGREATLRCESSGGRYKLCQAAVSGNVRLLRELSRSDCQAGRTWGWSRGGIWVDKGCRADFVYIAEDARGAYGRGDRPWRDGDDIVRGALRCESSSGRTNFCAAPIIGDVRLTKQLSRAPCRYGDTWKFDRNGITVRDGCRAEFSFDARAW